jgi:hypothetical protein
MHRWLILLCLLINAPLNAAENLALITPHQSANVTPPEQPPFVMCITTVQDITSLIASHLNIGEIAQLGSTCTALRQQIIPNGNIKPLLLENSLQYMLTKFLADMRYQEVSKVIKYFETIGFFKDIVIHCAQTRRLQDFTENLEAWFKLPRSTITLDSTSNLSVIQFVLRPLTQDLENWQQAAFEASSIYDLLSCDIPYTLANKFMPPKLAMDSLFNYTATNDSTTLDWHQISITPVPVNCLDAARPLTQLNVPYNGVAPLYKPLIALKTLHLLPTPIESWLVKTPPQYLCNVQAITIWDIEDPAFLQKHWDYLKQLTSLTDLTLKAKGATPLNLQTGNAPANLRTLTLTHFKIEHLDLTQLTPLQELIIADVTHNDFQNITISTHLTSLKYTLLPEFRDNLISFHETISDHLIWARPASNPIQFLERYRI